MKNDHKTLKSLAVLWLIALAPLMGMVEFIPKASATISSGVKVDTSSSPYATQVSTERHAIYTGSQWLIPYWNGTHTVYKTTSNLQTFSSKTVLLNNGYSFDEVDSLTGVVDLHVYGSSIYGCSVNATNVGGASTTDRLFFINGTVSGSTITWNQTAVIVVSKSAAGINKDEMNTCSVSYDGTTYWLGVDDEAALFNVNHYKSTDGGKTWTASGAANNNFQWSTMLSMAGGRAMMMFYSPTWIMYDLWNGAAWSMNNFVHSSHRQTDGFSAVNDGSNADIIYMVYEGTNAGGTDYNISFIRYNSGWGTPELVEDNPDSSSRPVITYDYSSTNIHVAWVTGNVVYGRTRYSSNSSWGTRYVLGNFTAEHISTPKSLSASQRNWNNKIVYLVTTGSGSPYNVTLISMDQDVPEPITPSGTLELSGLKCGDIWVTPDKTYLTATLTIQAQTVIQNASVRFNDSLNVIQADYDNTTARWNLSQGRDYVSLNPQATATSYHSTSPENYTLQVEFMFLANERILDKNDVEVQFQYGLQNGSGTSWTNGATMSIYNKGGATEYVIQNNAGFLPGGDVYSVYAKNSSSISVNQTWVRLQHLHANFAIRLVLNTTNSGEDNLWQDFAHKGTNEYYTNSTDWTLYYKIWYYDEQNGAWVQGWTVAMKHTGGDLGSADEWTQFNVTFYNGPNSVQTASQNMSAWVEREPEARVRLWLDLWFNKINASSVHGARVNPMYFGIHYTGWALWGTGLAGQWEPMYKNESQAAAFDRLQDANAVENVTSPMLTCMKSEQILVMNDNTYALEGLSPLHYNYTIQVDNWDVLEPKLSPTRNMEGVNTPLIVEPLLPDKTASSFWAPIYAALQSLGGWIFKAFASLAEVVWQAVRAQFPWFAEWVDNVNAALANGIEIANKMLSGIVEILKMVGSQVWIFGFITDFIGETWAYIYPILAPFTQNSTVWLTLLIIIFGILPIADNLTRGRWDLVQDDLEMIWGFMRTVIVGIYVIVSTLVGWLISALPL